MPSVPTSRSETKVSAGIAASRAPNSSTSSRSTPVDRIAATFSRNRVSRAGAASAAQLERRAALGVRRAAARQRAAHVRVQRPAQQAALCRRQRGPLACCDCGKDRLNHLQLRHPAHQLV